MGSSDNSKTYLKGVKKEKGTSKLRKSRNLTFNKQKMFDYNSLTAGRTRLDQDADLNTLAILNNLKKNNLIPISTEGAIKDKIWYRAMKTE